MRKYVLIGHRTSSRKFVTVHLIDANDDVSAMAKLVEMIADNEFDDCHDVTVWDVVENMRCFTVSL